ncbi:MAG: hypothetical protein QG549_205 [Patescibacteria group bacterium]|jgi:hypothetical protein|nr:hypothetical protein [Patescibacteria group bacterium]
MSLWEMVVRAGMTTLVIMAIVSVYERKLLWFPVVPGVVSFFAGYLTDDATVGALTFLVVYVVLAQRHPMRTRQLERDEALLDARHRLS